MYIIAVVFGKFRKLTGYIFRIHQPSNKPSKTVAEGIVRRGIMARRGENIYHRKDGRWEGRYIKARKSDGTPLFGSVYGYSYKAVQKRLLLLKAAYCELGQSTVCTEPFREYLLIDLAQKQACIKASSYDCYYRIVHKHILPGLGRYPMHQLTQQHMEQFITELRRSGQSDGSVFNIVRYLCGVTKQAAASGAMAKDICAGIVLPSPKRKKVNALSRADQKTVERAAMTGAQASEYRDFLDILIALNTGMRLGEICALRWEDIDLDDRRVIHVNHTLQRLYLYGQSAERKSKTAVVMDSPKSECSRRDIPINDFLLHVLQARRQFAKGKFVVEGRHGWVEPRVLQYRFEKLLEREQLPRIGYHALRHSFATRCAELNVDTMTISRLLGHSSSKTTEKTYIDSLMEQRFAAVCRLDELTFLRCNHP